MMPEKYSKNLRKNMDSKKYRIIFTTESLEDLKDIYNYIENQRYSYNIKINLSNAINKKLDDLEQFPYMYMEVKTSFFQQKCRRIVTKNYIILYEVDESNKDIIIHRIIHNRRDYLRDQIAKYMLQGTGVFI